MKELIKLTSTEEACTTLQQFFTDFYNESVPRLEIVKRRETKNQKIKRLEKDNDDLRRQIHLLSSKLSVSEGSEDGSGADTGSGAGAGTGAGAGAADGAGSGAGAGGSGEDSTLLTS